MPTNIIDSIQLSGVTYTLSAQTSGGDVSSAITSGDTNAVAGGAVYDKFDEVEQVTAAALNVLNESLSGKQDTLSAGTNITIVDNVISATGGGGKAIEAGRGITVTTGTTADTVSLNLAIESGTGTASIAEGNLSQAIGNFSHAEGDNTVASGNRSHAEGRATLASGQSSHAEGVGTETKNYAEHASGKNNVSSSASTTFGDSGNTLFSVGNGTSDNARHNAFEIRQDGSIFITSGGTDIKLQDHLGGGGGGTVDQTIISGSTNAVAGGAVYDKFDEVEQVTAAGLNALNDKFGGLKLQQITQSAYDNLQTKDPSTLYIILD